jgi:glycosyltransferase involved in cell wall biosynthesis
VDNNTLITSNPTVLPHEKNTFAGRLGLLQRVFPAYRAAFFNLLAAYCNGGLSVFAGEPRKSEAIATTTKLRVAQYAPARNRHFFSGPFYLCRQDGLIDWLEDWQPDALVVEANPRYVSTPRAVAWMHARNKPVLGWSLGAPPLTGPLAGFRLRARMRLLSSLDGLIAYSQRGAEEFHSLGIPPEKIFVAHNAAAPRPTNPPPDRPAKFEGAPTVLFVGRLQARKRLDHLFKACAALPGEVKPRLLIVGDGPAKELFEHQAEADYPQTEFLGARYRMELNEIFAQADLFVLPGTGGLAVQQAMSHGLPVIVAQGDGTQEDLARPENGWLVPPNDLEALTSALKEALSDQTRLRRMGAESYRITAEEINLEAMTEAFIQAIKQTTAEYHSD